MSSSHNGIAPYTMHINDTSSQDSSVKQLKEHCQPASDSPDETIII